MHKRKLLYSVTLLCLTASSALAQYTVKEMIFKNAAPYADTDLEATCGLKPGATFTTADLQVDAQHLIDTGAFDDVQVALNGPFKAITVTFTLKPYADAQLLQTGFENFVWWQPQQLTAAIHAKVPLFHGFLPEAGNMQDAVTTALQQLLAEKSIPATISHTVIEPSLHHPNRIVEYKIDKPSIRLSAVQITGISPAFQPMVDKITSSAIGKPYSEGLADLNLADQILIPYQALGYLDAALTHFDRTSSTSADHIDVAISATIHEGVPYRISKIEWPGSDIMTSSAFDAASKLHPEDIASRKALDASLKNLSVAYLSKGYMDAAITTSSTIDTATQHVAYTISVVPGQQYHLHSINTLNLSPNQRKDFDSAWKLQPGDLYNAEYVSTFLTQNTAIQSLTGYSATYKAIADPDSHLVDLTLNFVHGGTLINVNAN
jgi:outer membrane protein assembly factor BamA